MKNLKELFLIDPSVIFLNHGSFGATPKPVFEAYQKWQLELERQPVLFLGREFDGLLRKSREALGSYINADADDLVYIPNATYGVNIVARSLQLKEGDEILTSDHEYGACDYTWDFICNKAGAKYKHQNIKLPLYSDSKDIVESFFQGVNSRTKAIYISHITSPSTIKFPVEEICYKARQLGILSIVDGAHSLGQVPLAMDTIGADFYTSNCHKWALSPKGSAFLYARREFQDLIEPLVVSWGYAGDSKGKSTSRFVNILEWTGTRDPAAALSVPAALQFMAANNWEIVRQECHLLLQQALTRICELTQQEPIYRLDSNYYSQMGVAPLPNNVDLIILKSRLYDEFKVEVPFTQVGQMKFIRVSIQAYNDQTDVDVLVSALEKLLPESTT
jgi:isopenicillin-N epimerase